MLMNNGFQGDEPGLAAYNAVGDATIAQDMANPVSDAIFSSLSIRPNSGATGQVGAANEGYFGMKSMLSLNVI
jgi:alpha-N-arabinofuranosidase